MRNKFAAILLLASAHGLLAANKDKPSPVHYKSATTPVIGGEKPVLPKQPIQKSNDKSTDAVRMMANTPSKPNPARPAIPPLNTSTASAAKPNISEIAGPGAEEGVACYGADSPKLVAVTSHFPAGSKVRVTNLATGKSVVVTVTARVDLHGRIINVSKNAAGQLGFVKEGTTRVRLARVKDQTIASDN